MERLIFHVDVNSAYLSWEAARRVAAGESDIRLIPAAIGGDRDKRTGVILAKSIPAKKYGVQTGEPVAMALRKCPDLLLAKPDFTLYERNSRAFMDICRTFAPVVEKYSIDECFLDMTGTGAIYPDPIAAAHELKDTIRDTLGFTVNVGIGANKLLAKMASDFEKPDRCTPSFRRRSARSCGRCRWAACFRSGARRRHGSNGRSFAPSAIWRARALRRCRRSLGRRPANGCMIMQTGSIPPRSRASPRIWFSKLFRGSG